MKTETVRFPSKTLGREFSYTILLPEGDCLPVLYFLHGYGESPARLLECTPLARLAQELRLAMVLPHAGDGYYQDNERTGEAMASFLALELPEQVRTRYPVSPRRQDTLLAGVSMGGFGTLLLAGQHPRQFGAAACLSGAFISHAVSIGDPGVLGNADPQYFKDVFGDLPSLEGDPRRDCTAAALQAARRGELPPLSLLCGRRDPLYRPNLQTRDALRAARAQVVWQETDGGHDWTFWNKHLEDVLRWLLSQRNSGL